MPNARKGPVDRGNDRVIIQSDISVNLAVVAAHSDASWRRGEIRKRGGRGGGGGGAAVSYREVADLMKGRKRGAKRQGLTFVLYSSLLHRCCCWRGGGTAAVKYIVFPPFLSFCRVVSAA